MKKRVFSILTALCLCLSMLPVAAFAAEDSGAAPAEPQQEQREEVKPKADPEQRLEQPEQPEAKPAQEEKEAQEKQEPAPQPAQSEGQPVVLNGEDETVIELTQSNISNYMSSGLIGGSYQLGENVTIESGSLEVKGTVTLDLNGHTLLFKDPELYYPPIQGQVNAGIRVYNSDSSESAAKYALTLCDTSTAKTGTLDVWGESMAESGEGLFVGQNGELTMTGGTITDSSGTNPWGIGIGIIEGEVTMTGGKIENQTRCGVTLAGGTFEMSGDAVISNCGGNNSGGGIWIGGGTFTMSGGTIKNCNATQGGGVYVGAGTFIMSGGSIENCEAKTTDSNYAMGGGVYVANKGTFNMSGGSIENCKASAEDGSAFGGGIYNEGRTTLSGESKILNCQAANAGGGIYDYSVLNISDNVEITGCTAPLWSAMIVSGTISGGTFNGTVTSGGTITGGTFNGEVRNVGTITGGTFNSQVTNPGRITGGTFKGGITGTPALATGSGTEDDPYQIGTAIGLEWFRDKVNSGEYGLCAVLTGSIDLNNEEWTSIGNESNKYTGTFDGQGYTINGLNIDDADQLYVGLFGYIEGAAIKNLTVAGTVKGSKSIGGIVGGATKSSTIENCRNNCRVTSNAANDDSPSAAGIVSWASNTIIAGCVNTGMIEANGGYTGEAGGIVSTLSASVTIRNCCNTGEVKVSGNGDVGLYEAGGIVGASNAGTVVGCYNAGIVTVDCSGEATYFSYVGGIVGFAGHYGEGEAVYDCFNVGAVKAQGKVYVGGVVGRNSAAKVYNCYNAGAMTGPSIGGVVGSNSNAVENCYYLDSTAEKAIAENDAKYGTVDEATGPKTAVELGSGTVLALLINGRDDSEHPWNSECKYLAAAGKTLPVFNWQNGDEHTHTWSQWTHVDGTDTHSRSCTCNAVETENCFGGEATCTAKAKCVTCSAEYGDIDPTRHGDKLTHVDAKAATTSEDGNIEYWYCDACNKYFSDAAATKVITQADTVIPKRQSSGGSSSSSYPVTAPTQTENGSVTVSPKNASKGSTVTITVTPDSGYVLETISVTDKNGNNLKLIDKGNGKYTFTLPGSKVEVKVAFMEDNSVLNFFYDVPNDAYYYEAVKWAAENGITGGIGNSLFAPNQPCTRAQLVTFLWRVAGSPVVNYLMPFTDVDEGAYYAEAVRWAASTGIVTGLTETTFGTNGVCTRAQAAAMIYRYAQAQGKGFTGAWMFLLPFTDVPEWAYESVAWCYMNGVTTGVSETAFAPGNDCTRAQIVTFLYRAYQGN